VPTLASTGGGFSAYSPAGSLEELSSASCGLRWRWRWRWSCVICDKSRRRAARKLAEKPYRRRMRARQRLAGGAMAPTRHCAGPAPFVPTLLPRCCCVTDRRRHCVRVRFVPQSHGLNCLSTVPGRPACPPPSTSLSRRAVPCPFTEPGVCGSASRCSCPSSSIRRTRLIDPPRATLRPLSSHPSLPFLSHPSTGLFPPVLAQPNSVPSLGPARRSSRIGRLGARMLEKRWCPILLLRSPFQPASQRGWASVESLPPDFLLVRERTDRGLAGPPDPRLAPYSVLRESGRS